MTHSMCARWRLMGALGVLFSLPLVAPLTLCACEAHATPNTPAPSCHPKAAPADSSQDHCGGAPREQEKPCCCEASHSAPVQGEPISLAAETFDTQTVLGVVSDTTFDADRDGGTFIRLPAGREPPTSAGPPLYLLHGSFLN